MSLSSIPVQPITVVHFPLQCTLQELHILCVEFILIFTALEHCRYDLCAIKQVSMAAYVWS
jgi:hypothetical protein